MTYPPRPSVQPRTYDLGEAKNHRLLGGAVVVAVLGVGGLDLAFQQDRPVAVRVGLGVVGGFFVLLALVTPLTVRMRRRSGRRVLLTTSTDGLAFDGPTGPWTCCWADVTAALVVEYEQVNSAAVGSSALHSQELRLTLRDGEVRRLFLGAGVSEASCGVLAALAAARPDLPVGRTTSVHVPDYRAGERQQDDTYERGGPGRT